jgi:TPR repeat protein
LKLTVIEAQAAEKGDPVAQGNIGYFYLRGRKVEQDIVTAAMWIAEVAANGCGVLQYRLGFLYEKGVGIEKKKTYNLLPGGKLRLRMKESKQVIIITWSSSFRAHDYMR